jgi:putative membrane protein
MNRDTAYKLFLLLALLVVWAWAAWHPLFREDWLLENWPVLAFVPVVIISRRWIPLSNFSYTLLTLFLILHMVGSHYTYGHVPFGETLRDWLGADRNMYDRLVHFAYGFLFAYPLFEFFGKVSGVKGFWNYFFPIEFILASSAVYEMIEWIGGVYVAPTARSAFVGAQGDLWDAQKDMALAGVGACLAIGIAVATHVVRKRVYASRRAKDSSARPLSSFSHGK